MNPGTPHTTYRHWAYSQTTRMWYDGILYLWVYSFWKYHFSEIPTNSQSDRPWSTSTSSSFSLLTAPVSAQQFLRLYLALFLTDSSRFRNLPATAQLHAPEILRNAKLWYRTSTFYLWAENGLLGSNAFTIIDTLVKFAFQKIARALFSISGMWIT